MENPLIGKYCIFRGRMFGVKAGRLTGVIVVGNVTMAVVQDCRRLQYQDYEGFTLDSVADKGLGSESRLGPVLAHPQLLSISPTSGDCCEIIACSDEMGAIITAMPSAT